MNTFLLALVFILGGIAVIKYSTLLSASAYKYTQKPNYEFIEFITSKKISLNAFEKYCIVTNKIACIIWGFILFAIAYIVITGTDPFLRYFN